MTPKFHAMVAKDYDKFKYGFRIHGEAVQLVKEIMACFQEIKEKYGLDKVFIMVQDVAHARGGGQVLGKVAAGKGWQVLGTEIYPTGTTDFSMGLIKAKKAGAQILNIWMDHAGKLHPVETVVRYEGAGPPLWVDPGCCGTAGILEGHGGKRGVYPLQCG